MPKNTIKVKVDKQEIIKSISAAQRKKDPHAGPHGSFPEDREHIKAAWDLAGHAKDPDAVRRKILEWARQHNAEHLLPDTAKEHIQKAAMLIRQKRMLIDEYVRKAKTEDVQNFMNMAWEHESGEGDEYEKRRIVRWADEHGMLNLLPDEAHSIMHQINVGHNHEGVENDEDGTHQHPVTKAYNPVTFDGTIIKSWDDSKYNDDLSKNDVFYEGWLSTPKRDTQKDIVEPEAFLEAIPEYFLRRAPVSVVHGTDRLPAGHLMKAAVMRSGKTLLEVDHPSDKGTFDHKPSEGSGVWVLGRLTEDPAKSSVRKGNCGGMSFIGNGVEFTPLPGGGKRYTRINPMLESTVAPYPVNTEAYMAVIKAFGLEPEPQKEDQNPMPEEKSLEEMLLEAAQALEAKEKQNVQKGPTLKEEIAAMLAKQQETTQAAIQKAVTDQVTAIFDQMRAQPGNRQSTVVKKSVDDLRDEDPVGYVLSKSNSTIGHEDFEQADKDFVAEITKRFLFEGLRND